MRNFQNFVLFKCHTLTAKANKREVYNKVHKASFSSTSKDDTVIQNKFTTTPIENFPMIRPNKDPGS